MPQNNQNFITLKEAAKISGYAPDYIGQLIRKGKLPGKQIYCNVAWMTTEEAVKKYMQNSSNHQEKNSSKKGLGAKMHLLASKLFRQIQAARLLRLAACVAIIWSIIFFLLLFYIFSVSIEKKLQQEALREVESIENWE